ncbi:Senescence-specific cysteine protease SAG12 [Vitis vinifera]|uniref:Senescence-specific cysteine protease SAG12 n=1 Tax=Vitis vinifera TaxID=29760 RepID=A0A438CRB5_VITVI|nr:Senescence-specific cysteine protease SAG12 [Vitis vinifera]
MGVWASQALSRTLHEVSMSERHEDWMGLYGRTYKDIAEKERRFKIFKENVEYIESVNSAGNRPVPSSMDWRKKGAVTPLRTKANVGVAGHFLQWQLWKGGCGGGLMDSAFEFIIGNGGLTTEANYPYKGVDATCNKKKAASSAAKIKNYEDVPANSEAALLKAVAQHPVSVAIDAGGSDFQFYSSGVFTGQIRGGTGWGEDGYIWMERDIGADEGLCGIAMEASYPTA